MLRSKTILVIDRNAYVALDLASEIEQRGGQVAGPVVTADEALTHLAADPVDGAILDADIIGASAIAAILTHRRIPFVLQAGAALPAPLRRLCDPAAVLVRPVDSALVLSLLAAEVDKADEPSPPSPPMPLQQ